MHGKVATKSGTNQVFKWLSAIEGMCVTVSFSS